MPGRIEFDMTFSTAGKGKRRRDRSSPMQILIMGNFGGHCRDVADIGQIRKLDLDNFELLMAKMAPRLELSLVNHQADVIEIEFRTLEDFHPDGLFDRLPLFQRLKTLRADLGNPATFTQAAAQLTGDNEAAAKPAESVKQTATQDDAGLLDQLLGDRAAHIASEPTAIEGQKRVDISAFIKKAIAPHIEATINPQQSRYVESVDHTISELMREILHHPQFQALEAAWRSVHECITRLELDESLNIYLLDVSKEQLQKEFDNYPEDIAASSLYRTIVEQNVQTLGGEPWSLLIGLYSFANDNGDIALLSKIGQMAYHSGGPFIASAHPRLFGCDSLVEQADASQWSIQNEADLRSWNELRNQPYARWLGLTFPRFLLRLPYGAKTDEIERFKFEEIPANVSETQRHSDYLWGNGATTCAVLVAQSYQHSGWSLRLGEVSELDDLPLYVYEQQGEKMVKPCAEVIMSERSAEVIENHGVMPILSYKNRNSVRLWRFRSLDIKNGGLAGPWVD